MPKYVIYDETTGEILKHGVSSAASFNSKIKIGEKIVKIDSLNMKMDAKFEVDIKTKQLKEKVISMEIE